MSRLRMARMLAAAALLAAACGADADPVVTTADSQDQADTAATAASEPAAEVAEPESSEADTDAPEDGATTDDGEADAASDAGTAGDGDAPPDAGTTGDGATAETVDAAALLASAMTQLDGRSVRGEATFQAGPDVSLPARFESDTDGDLAVMIELPSGSDPRFPEGADAEFRYVGGVIYVRPPVPAETLAELGIDEAWHTAEPFTTGDPATDAMASGGDLMCVFPLSVDTLAPECDPLGDIGTILSGARNPQIIGREDVRGTEATRVSLQLSLLDMIGEALGEPFGEDETDTPDGEFFDEGSTDPLAGALEEILSMFDTGFEVEIWIDDDNLVRRLSFDVAAMLAGFADPDEVVPASLLTVEFYDFDADISVEAPPPELVVDLSQFQYDDSFLSPEMS